MGGVLKWMRQGRRDWEQEFQVLLVSRPPRPLEDGLQRLPMAGLAFAADGGDGLAAAWSLWAPTRRVGLAKTGALAPALRALGARFSKRIDVPARSSARRRARKANLTQPASPPPLPLSSSPAQISPLHSCPAKPSSHRRILVLDLDECRRVPAPRNQPWKPTHETPMDPTSPWHPPPRPQRA